MEKYRTMLNEMFKGLQIVELDEELIWRSDTSDTFSKLSKRYQELLKTVTRSFNSFVMYNNEQPISFDTIIRYLQQEEKRLAYKTFYTHVQSLKTLLFNQPEVLNSAPEKQKFFKLLINGALNDKGLVDYDKLQKKNVRTKLQPLTKKQISMILRKNNPRTRAFVEFILRTGCNVNQLAKLRKDAVHIKQDIVEIDVPVDKDLNRRVFIDRIFFEKVLNAFNSGRQGEYIFQTRDHDQIKRSYMYREIKQAGIAAGLSTQLDVQTLIDTFVKMLKTEGISATMINSYVKYGSLYDEGRIFTPFLKKKMIDVFSFMDEVS